MAYLALICEQILQEAERLRHALDSGSLVHGAREREPVEGASRTRAAMEQQLTQAQQALITLLERVANTQEMELALLAEQERLLAEIDFLKSIGVISEEEPSDALAQEAEGGAGAPRAAAASAPAPAPQASGATLPSPSAPAAGEVPMPTFWRPAPEAEEWSEDLDAGLAALEQGASLQQDPAQRQ